MMLRTGLILGLLLVAFPRSFSLPTTEIPYETTLNVTDDSIGCRKPGIKYPIGIEYEELIAGVDASEILLIDIRQPWELLKFGELEGSVNLPLQELEDAFLLNEVQFLEKYKFEKPIPGDENVVLTCRSGRRVLVAYDFLEPKGYCNMRIYFGSYLDWKANGGPLIFR